MWSRKSQDTLETDRSSQQGLTDCYKHDKHKKAPARNISMTWKQSSTGGGDEAGNTPWIKASNVQTLVVYPAASSLLICTVNKCAEWWGHRAGLFSGGKELSHWPISRQTDLSTVGAGGGGGWWSTAGSRRNSQKLPWMHQGIKIIFSGKKKKRKDGGIVIPWPWHPAGWRR